MQFFSLEHVVWEGSQFKTLLINTHTFSLLSPCIVVFSLTKKGASVLVQNNMERKLPLEADYAGPMAERKHSRPRNGPCPSPHSSPPPQLSRCQGTCLSGSTSFTCSVPTTSGHTLLTLAGPSISTTIKRPWKWWKIGILQPA